MATLTELGPNAPLQTTVVGTGHLGPGGVWHGNLYLVGGGDPTFGDGAFNRNWEQGYGPTANQLVGQLAARRDQARHRVGDRRRRAVRRAPRRSGDRLRARTSPTSAGSCRALTYDHGSTFKKLNPGAFAAKELVLTMHGAGIGARAAEPDAAGARPGPSSSPRSSLPPLSVMLKLMDVPSDDFFAEMLTKQLGVRFGDRREHHRRRAGDLAA